MESFIESWREFWRDFWYKPVDNGDIPFDGMTYNVRFEFRTERLINIIIFILLVLFILSHGKI